MSSPDRIEELRAEYEAAREARADAYAALDAAYEADADDAYNAFVAARDAYARAKAALEAAEREVRGE